jgi:short subunit dehydrogenase-like uncharacterized protein
LRDHDIVLFGATGFTGRLVAEYLRDHRGRARVAWAGRDVKKLEARREELGVDTPILVADVTDTASLASMARSTKVVCTTVGPYAKYGSGLVAACARAGTDYCDLTGEPQWIRRMIDAHDEEARRTEARIVHCCGFDSIPSDLGTLVMQTHAKTAHDAPCASIRFALRRSRGGASGGTVASMLQVVEETKRDPSVRKLLQDPYGLYPEGERPGPDRSDTAGVSFDHELDAWIGPFVMAAINAKIVRRSNALAGYPYGRDFRYSEVVAFPRGPKGLAMAAGMGAGIGAFMAGAAIDPVRRLLERTVLPAPGDGPSAEARERGYFDIELLGKGTDAAGSTRSASSST